jgi:1-acyl-sn-glycerol-3-phosphate acyltransferase
MGHTYWDYLFVGKHELGNVPLFGYMFRNLHISVDRSSLRDRHNAWVRSKEAIDQGKSLVIFPEGGIVTREPPNMGRFKEGAFKVAIEKQIPIVPVTIPYNWIALFDENFILKRRSLGLVYHKPIETSGMSLEDVGRLKEKTYTVIDLSLKELNHDH